MYLMRNKPELILNDETLTFSRYLVANAAVIDGLRTYAATDVIHFTCKGNIQPVSGRDLLMAPEGEREQSQLKAVFWKDDCEMLPEAGDLVTRDGVYKVTNATDWGAFVKCQFARDDASVIANG